MGTRRSDILDEATYAKKIAFREKFIGIFTQNQAKPENDNPERRTQLTYSAFKFDLELLVTRYSAGDDLPSLREQLPRVVRNLAAYAKVVGPYRPETIDHYPHALWLVAFAYALHCDDTTWRLLVDSLDAGGQDAILDRLIALRAPNGKPTGKLLHPNPYQHLLSALDASGAARSAGIKKFLDGWYKGMKEAYWYDNHKPKDPGFFGYWAFEVAAFVKALKIDDTPFADHPNYPRDLARG